MLVAQPETDVRAEHVRRPEDPVPRWSSTTRSRVASAGAMFVARRSTNGIAACPGPPARPMTAVLVGFAAARRGRAGPADDRRVGRIRRRHAALDAERQRAGGGARWVERDGEVAALV